MDFLQYLRLTRKWLWLFTVAAFVGAGIGYTINSQRPDEYVSRATVAIGQFLQDPNPNASSVTLALTLAPTYARIATTHEVLQGTIDALSLGITPEALRRLITTRTEQGTNLLYIQVTYPDPILSADIANEIVRQLQNQGPSGLTRQEQENIAFAIEQRDQLTEQLLQLQAQRSQLEPELAAAVTNSNQQEITRLSELRSSLLSQINQIQATLVQYTTLITQLQTRNNIVVPLEAARVPNEPIRVNSLNTALVGVLAGLALAFAVVLLIEYLDDTIHTTEQAAQTLALPVLGALIRFGKRNDSYANRLITPEKSMTPIAEGYRGLRTNLLFTSKGSGKPVFVITSANPEEGKSLTSANLAITMALAGLQVVLIDADLRRPKMHEVFQLDNQVGLTTLLFADPLHYHQNGDENQLPVNLRQCLQSTAIPRLRVITSGFIPSNPSEILGSALMERWIDTLRSSTNIDVVIIDTPPCLLFADSAVLAMTAKADVVLVVDAGHTRRDAALHAKEEFAKLGIEIKGVVVNRINPRDERGKYGYGYTYGYYYTSREVRQKKNGRAPGRAAKAREHSPAAPVQPPTSN